MQSARHAVKSGSDRQSAMPGWIADHIWPVDSQPARPRCRYCGHPYRYRHPWNGQPKLRRRRGWRLAAAASYTATRRAGGRPFAFSPGCSDFPAFSGRSGRMAASRAECEVQRRVHPHVSRQYQRTSRQALPPSATIWCAGRRMPHIQHDLTGDDSPSSEEGCRLVITCSPRSPATRSVVSACAAGLPTVASVRSASRSSAESLIPIHPPRAMW
jgi:hypothetical protein